MKSDSRSLPKPKVVVVGGSFAGLCAIRHLRGKADITLVEPHEFFEYTPGILHLLAGSKADDALVSPISEVAKGALIKKGKFVGLSSKSQTVLIQTHDHDPEEVPFDALLLCSGTPYTAPIRAAEKVHGYLERLEDIKSFTQKLRDSKRIVVAGGGLVGVELVAELSERLKSTISNVTLISRSSLLASLPPATGIHAMNWLQKQPNVNVILNDEIVDHPSENLHITKTGRELIADLFIDCTFSKPAVLQNSDKIPQLVDSSDRSNIEPKEQSLKEGFVSPYGSKGKVLVDENLKAVEFPSSAIFAAGDVAEHSPGVGFACSTERSGPFGTLARSPAVSNAHLAESQAEIVAANVMRILANRNKGAAERQLPLLRYPQDVFGAPLCPLLSCVSLGPHNGIIVFDDLVIGGALLGVLGALAKFVVERSKVAEIRNKLWGRAFWAFGHVVANFLHCAHIYFRVFFLKLKLRLKRFTSAGPSPTSLNAKGTISVPLVSRQ